MPALSADALKESETLFRHTEIFLSKKSMESIVFYRLHKHPY